MSANLGTDKPETVISADSRVEEVPYFADPSLKQRLDLLHHLVDYADLLLVVKGPYGAGKSALLGQLVSSSLEHWVVCRIDATPLTTRDQFLTLFADQLSVLRPDASTEALEQALADQLEIQQKSGHVVLLLVDDAHALAAPVLDLIVHLHELTGTEGKLLRVLLFAESGLEEALQSPALQPLAQRITHTLDVPPLAREQSRAFLEHVLSHRRSPVELPLADQVVTNAHERSEGNPGRLLLIADEIDRDRTPEEDETPSSLALISRFTQPRYWVGATVAVLVVGVLLLQDEINALFEKEPPTVVRADRAGTVDLPLPPSEVSKRPRVSRAPSSPVGNLPRVETTPSNAPVEDAQDTAISESKEPVGGAATDPNAVTEPPQTVVATPPPPAISPVPETVSSQKADKPPAQVVSKVPVAGKVAGQLLPGIRGREWIEAQPKNHFTLQLLGVRELNALREFVTEHQLADQVGIFETRFNGAPWFVLLHGSYPNRAAAQRDRDRLVKSLRRVQPWPRTFQSVHEQLRSGKN